MVDPLSLNLRMFTLILVGVRKLRKFILFFYYYLVIKNPMKTVSYNIMFIHGSHLTTNA